MKSKNTSALSQSNLEAILTPNKQAVKKPYSAKAPKLVRAIKQCVKPVFKA